MNLSELKGYQMIFNYCNGLLQLCVFIFWNIVKHVKVFQVFQEMSKKFFAFSEILNDFKEFYKIQFFVIGHVVFVLFVKKQHEKLKIKFLDKTTQDTKQN